MTVASDMLWIHSMNENGIYLVLIKTIPNP